MLPEIRKILYSTDLSKGSTAAFEQATYLAKKTGAEIHILHVVEKLSSDAKITFQTYVMDSKSRHDILKERVHRAEDKLMVRQEHFWDELYKDESDVRKQIKSINVVEAYPAETVIKYSKELDVDIIVMGTHEKGIMHTFLGSVAKNVLNRSRIPVLIVPLPEKEG
ncbi:universal stress protein [Pontibacterium sp. N1Y112]|uniref:Universal stress protein n=1 Tax=Pontibacterium sinense TaxID=2781979 RepID=A0A8J7KAN5_9GAMM|nr:universal stress protein [Pontibacterium sinense]MBE9398221.1 universal stress protein [Pontibacterium sinense]